MKEKKFSERIRDLRDKFKLNQDELAPILGMKTRMLQRYENAESEPQETALRRYLPVVEELEAENDTGRFKKIGKHAPDTVNDEQAEYGKAKPSRQIPIFELDVSASNIQLFSDGPEVISGYMSFPGFEDCDFGIYVRGDSMYPTYKNGYAIACKRINDMSIIQYGEPYLIITSEQRMVKRLQKGSSKESLLCKSDNPSSYEDGRKKFEDFEIPRKKILRLYLVKGEANRSQI